MSESPRIAVTGAAGHLGSHLIPQLLEEGFDVTGLDIVRPPSTDADAFVQADLTVPESFREIIRNAELIVHCASIHPWKSYRDGQYIDANIKGTWNLYATAAELGIGRIILTSSIAAAGYQNVPLDAWPICEEEQFPLGDLYSFTKHAQEDIARMFAQKGQIRTIALRPPAFFPLENLPTGFSLTGNFARVDDIVSAHVAAARVMAKRQPGDTDLQPFEAIHVTNRLPYTSEDAALLEPGRNVRRLVEKHWPEAYEWLVTQGYQGGGICALYDLSKARRILGWEPRYNFEQWFAEQG